MYKVGDIVLLREDADNDYVGTLNKGGWYVVLDVMEYGGSQFVSIKDEDHVAAWYLSSIFTPVFLKGGRAVKEDGSDSDVFERQTPQVLPMFQVGQKVWDVVRGDGVVSEILKWEEYPVIVAFNREVYSYTTEGKYFENDAHPSLYPYEPKIVKAENNGDEPFTPTFEQGDLVQVKFVGSVEIHDTMFLVEKETKDAIYMKGNHFFLKSQISNIYSLYREEIKLG